MNTIDSIGLKLCSFQAEIFKASVEKSDCSSMIFIRRFMNSAFAERMDCKGFSFGSVSVSDAFDEIEEQYGSSTYGKNKFAPEELYWMGYIYRYWAYVSEKTSKQIYKIIQGKQLRDLYFPYHSLDPMQAIERILEANETSLSFNVSDIERGVKIMRRIYEMNERG